MAAGERSATDPGVLRRACTTPIVVLWMGKRGEEGRYIKGNQMVVK
jgi:hypothetical protein